MLPRLYEQMLKISYETVAKKHNNAKISWKLRKNEDM